MEITTLIECIRHFVNFLVVANRCRKCIAKAAEAGTLHNQTHFVHSIQGP